MPRKSRRRPLSGTKCFNTRKGRVCFKVKRKSFSGLGQSKMNLRPGQCARTNPSSSTGCSMILCRLQRPTQKNPTGYKFKKGSSQCGRRRR